MNGMQLLNDLTTPQEPSTIEVEDEEHIGEVTTPAAPAPQLTPAPLPATTTATPSLPTVPAGTTSTQVPPAPTTGQQGKKGSGKGPQLQTMTVVPRKGALDAAQTANGLHTPDMCQQVTLTPAEHEANLVALLNKHIALASHDRAMALSILQVHLDRGEVLDAMPLSMPVATAISDNTSAILKATELAQKAGKSIFDSAKLLVDNKKSEDANLVRAFTAQLNERKLNGDNDSGWGDASDLPDEE